LGSSSGSALQITNCDQVTVSDGTHVRVLQANECLSLARRQDELDFETIGRVNVDDGTEITDASVMTQLKMVEQLGKGKYRDKDIKDMIRDQAAEKPRRTSRKKTDKPDEDDSGVPDVVYTDGADAPDTDDGETLEETMKRLNEEAKAETGDGVPGKKEAKSVEEFYGQWKDSKFTLLGEDYDMSEYNEGVFIGENTYYVTLNGEKSPDYLYPETAELSIGNGILKVNSDGHWTNFVLTEDGSMVQPSGTIQIYFVRAE
jgi:hypothetical protein